MKQPPVMNTCIQKERKPLFFCVIGNKKSRPDHLDSPYRTLLFDNFTDGFKFVAFRNLLHFK